MLNKFIGIGRWTGSVDLRYSKDGKAVANATIAINDKFNKDNTTFLRCVMFGKNAENTAQFTDKGSLVAIEARIQTRSYDKDGVKQFITEAVCDFVNFLDSKGDKPQQNNQQQSNSADPFANSGQEIDDSSLPF